MVYTATIVATRSGDSDVGTAIAMMTWGFLRWGARHAGMLIPDASDARRSGISEQPLATRQQPRDHHRPWRENTRSGRWSTRAGAARQSTSRRWPSPTTCASTSRCSTGWASTGANSWSTSPAEWGCALAARAARRQRRGHRPASPRRTSRWPLAMQPRRRPAGRGHARAAVAHVSFHVATSFRGIWGTTPERLPTSTGRRHGRPARHHRGGHLRVAAGAGRFAQSG